MAEDLAERSEEPTPKRQLEAREEGNAAKSQDLSSAVMLLLCTLVLWLAVMHMLGQGKVIVGEALLPDVMGLAIDPAGAWALLVDVGHSAARIAAPMLLAAWAAAFLAQFAQVGWIFAPKAARPKFSKLNPLSGFKRIFGISGFVKSSLDAMKVGLVVVVTVLTLAQYREEIAVLAYLSPMEALGRTIWMMLDMSLRVLAILIALGFIDYIYQRWKRHQDLRMTKQQVKDEMKQTEGDPDVKRRRIRMQREIAMQRISSSVPKADVIVTNPEHISVAIQYDSTIMRAPRVVAKGADFVAMRIRYIAMQHGIPIVERKPLARALYREVAVNQEIPATFYKAVAEILAYVYRLAGRSVA